MDIANVPLPLQLRLSAPRSPTGCRSEVLADARRKARLASRSTRAKQRISLVRQVRVATQQSDQSKRREAQLEVEAKLRDAANRRSKALDAISTKAANVTSKVSEAREHRIATSSMMENSFRQQEMKAATLRKSKLQNKRRRVQDHLQAVKTNCDRVRAARQLQRAWRSRSSSPDDIIAVHAAVTGLAVIDRACEGTNFEQACALIQSRAAMDHARQLMAATASSSIDVEAQSVIATSPRTLLVALLIKHHPDRVFEDDGARQLRLRASASELLSTVRCLEGVPQHTAIDATLDGLAKARHSFVHHFLAWKKEDGRRLAATVLHSYTELLQMQHSVGQSELWQRGISRQLKQLERQLKQLLGEQCAAQYIRELQEEQSNLPAEAEPEPEPEPATATSRSTFKSGFLLDAAEQKRAARKRTQSRSPAITPPASPAVAPADPYRNLDIATQLMRSPTGALPAACAPASPNPLEMQVHQMMRQAMDDKFAEQIKSADHSMLRQNLLELRDGMISLVPNRPDIATELRDGMPVESITAHEGVPVDATRLAILLECAVSWIVQLEAPVDNEQTRLWHAETLSRMSDQSRNISAVVPAAVWWLLNKVQRIKLDVATAHARALLRANGCTFQKDLALQAIAEGKLDICEIESWINQQLQALAGLAISPTPTGCVAAGVAAVVTGRDVPVPEHLETHSDELTGWRAQLAATVQQQVLTIALKSVTPQQPQKAIFDALALQLLDYSAESSRTALTSVLEKFEAQPTADQLKYLERMAQNSVQCDDAVYMLIMRRLTTALIRSTVQQQPLTDAWLNSHGLPFAADSIRKLCKEVSSLVQHHCNIFGSLYDQMIKDLNVDCK